MPPIGAGTARISGKGQHPERGHHRQGTAPRARLLPAPHNRQPTNRSTSRPEGAGSRSRRQLTGRSRRQSRWPERPGRPGQRPAKGTTRTADQPPDPASRGDATSNSKHKSTTVYQNEKGREARTGRDTRHVCPSLAGALAGKAPACGRLAALRGACLGLAGRGNGRHSRPQAAFSCAPPRAKRGKGGACAASARGGLNCGPPQGQGLQQQPAAGAPARLGGGTPSEGPRAATPGGECVGRAARHGLRRRRGRAGKAGRSAADRAGGADGPKAPMSGGRAAPEHLRRNRARAVPGARPAKRPACGLGLAAGTGGPRYGWRPT